MTYWDLVSIGPKNCPSRAYVLQGTPIIYALQVCSRGVLGNRHIPLKFRIFLTKSEWFRSAREITWVIVWRISAAGNPFNICLQDWCNLYAPLRLSMRVAKLSIYLSITKFLTGWVVGLGNGVELAHSVVFCMRTYDRRTWGSPIGTASVDFGGSGNFTQDTVSPSVINSRKCRNMSVMIHNSRVSNLTRLRSFLAVRGINMNSKLGSDYNSSLQASWNIISWHFRQIYLGLVRFWFWIWPVQSDCNRVE